MQKYNYKTHTLGYLYHKVSNGEINTCPSYQREIVWSPSKMTNLIDTLMNGLPMPSINLAVNTDPSLPKNGVCLDGKNRLETLKLFMSSQLKFEGQTFSELSQSQQEDFKNIEVQVCVFHNISNDEQEEYFRRIQEGVSLSQCERINSYCDHNLVKAIKEARDHSLDIIKTICPKTNRYEDLTLLCNISSTILGDKSIAGHSTAMVRWIKNKPKDSMYTHVKIGIIRVFEILSHLHLTLHKSYQTIFILDVCRHVILYPELDPIKFEKFSIELFKLAIGQPSCSTIVSEYYSILKTGGALSHQYNNKVTMDRQILLVKD